MSEADPEAIAAVLHIDESVVRRLQARGYLQSFALTNAEVRRRLYLAHIRRGPLDPPRRRSRRVCHLWLTRHDDGGGVQG